MDEVCSICRVKAGNSFVNDPNPNSFNDSQNFSDYPPQSQYQTNSCELCGNDAHYGYDCPPQVPFAVQKEQEEQAVFTPYWRIPIIDDDNDEYTIQYRKYLENSSNAITPDLSTEEPDNSLSMGDEHLDTILETEWDEVIKSSVEDLVPIPNIRLVEKLLYDNSPPLDALNDHFEILFDFNDDCTSSDNDSFEDIDYVEASPLDSELVSLEKGELTRVVVDDISNNSTRELRVYVPNILPTHPTLFLDLDFIPSDESLRSDLEVSFPSGTRNRFFDPGILFEVQSKRFLSRDTFSISFIRNPLC
ncbi:hypothetical protein Tco_0939455 [Tanacetum coccineum]|uniref:Uncharacterized protein n=1 Tax=Tanacetum coccineum TaxID=301880 RepID=A0ABQ5DK42_9ASTR